MEAVFPGLGIACTSDLINWRHRMHDCDFAGGLHIMAYPDITPTAAFADLRFTWGGLHSQHLCRMGTTGVGGPAVPPIGPGATSLTRMPNSPHSNASVRVKLSTAALAADA